jgi:scyllo-inositol 2-dehydrogenase (NADP+)
MPHLLVFGDDKTQEQLEQFQATTSGPNSVPLPLISTTTAAQLQCQKSDQVVVASSATGSISQEQADAISQFVLRGGSALIAGEAADSWCEQPLLQEMLGAGKVQRAPATELMVQVAGDHDITRRLDPTFPCYGTAFLVERAPAEAVVLLAIPWRFARLPLAYLRSWGAGHVCYVGLDEQALRQPTLQRFLFRATRYLGGWREGPPLGVAMIGYGAIGVEHGMALSETDGLAYRLVCDRSPDRLEAARAVFPNVKTTAEMSDITNDASIGAVIVCTPPNTHAAVAQQMLEAGKHVIVEKPFCLTTAEADRLISLADQRHLTLTVYQNRRWDADFLAIQQVIQAGTIGDVFHIEAFIGGFSHPCNFWHSHEPVSGGVFYDWGSHYLDWVLLLLQDEVHDVRASTQKRVWQDVTNADQACLWLRFAGGQDVNFIHSDIAALLKPKWYILGTKGAIVANWRQERLLSRSPIGTLAEESLVPADALPEVIMAIRTSSGQIHEQRLSLPPVLQHPFHRNLADHLLAGEPLAVTAASARRTIAVMEAARYSAAHDAALVQLNHKDA